MIPARGGGRGLTPALVFLTALSVWGCSSGSGADPASEVRLLSPESGSTFSAIRVLLEWETSQPCEACSYRLQVYEQDGAGETDPELVLDDGAIPEPRTVLGEAVLTWDRTYLFRVAAVEGGRAGPFTLLRGFRTAPLHPMIPRLEVTVPASEAAQPGLTLLSLSTLNLGFGLAVTLEGRVVWFTERPWLGVGDIEKVAPGVILTTTGYYHSAREETVDGSVLWLSDEPPEAFVHHEVVKLPDGHYMYLAEVHQLVTFEAPDIGTTTELWRVDEVREVDADNTVVWTWNVLDQIGSGVYDSGLPGGIRDFSHCNAIAFDTYRNDWDSFLLSCRNLSRVFKIRRSTGEVLWAFGGDGGLTGTYPFDLEGDAEIYFQHSPEFTPEGTILVYDNGNNRPGLEPEEYYTRSVEVRVDEAARRADVVWEYRHEEYSDASGHTNLLPGGNLLITNMNGPVLEIRRDTQSPEWRLEWDDPLYFAYRAERIPDLY